MLSGLAAAYLFGLIRGTAPPPEISAPAERKIKGVNARQRRLDLGDKTVWRGIPATTVPRTVIDLSSLLSLDELAQAFHEASVRYHTRHAWERDRQREREAYARGDQFRRFTRDDVFERAEQTIRELRPLLTPPESRAASCSP